ncbi:MAG: AAA family ATPase [Desulfovibrio sp.]|jgi:replicative DNA helicase|nr:AAA family ATPase [Desulfovibrio sp.]
MSAPGRVPPHSSAAEQSVLGACLSRPGKALDVLDGVQPDIFYSPAHRNIAEAMLRLLADGQPVDLVTVTDRMQSLGTLHSSGGPVYLAELSCSPVSSVSATRHVDIIRGHARRRAVIEIAQGLIESAYDPQKNHAQYAAEVQPVIDSILEDRVNVPSQRPSQVAQEAYAAIERMSQGHGELMKSSLYGLNELIGGYVPGEVSILAGRPGTGKTALALCEAKYLLKKGHPGGIFSLEMKNARLAQRFFAQHASVDAQRFRDGKFTDEDMAKVLAGTDWLAKMDDRLRFWDRPGLTVSEFRAQIRKWKREIGIKWIVVDYVQKLRADKRCNSREQEVAEISRGVTEAAGEYDVAVLLLAQLNREADTAKTPLLSQLRESGALEADADIIIFIKPWDARTAGDVVSVQLDVAKGRSSRTGSTEAWYRRKYLRFENMDYQRRGEGD